MISPLRRRHRRVMLGLALLLPLAFAAALASRPAQPIEDAMAEVLAERETIAAFAPGFERARLSDELPIAIAVGDTASGALAARIDSRDTASVPDALVYWSAAPSRGPELPARSYLLGAVPENDVRVLALPEVARAGGGRVLVWSAGWQRVVGELELP